MFVEVNPDPRAKAAPGAPPGVGLLLYLVGRMVTRAVVTRGLQLMRGDTFMSWDMFSASGEATRAVCNHEKGMKQTKQHTW